jgi:hypothetical protein
VQTITVRDTAPPVIACPADVTLECPAITTTNVTGAATATDGCSSVAISYSDSVSNSCAGTKVIARTWIATDACGNRASCVQTITVRDTTPPVITCPADVTLECPAITTTNVTGAATATDGCSSVSISYSDSVSNTCGSAQIIRRLWTATDACGNQVSCLQTITVRDTTPPTLVCATNRTVPAGVAWSFDSPAATDTCSVPTVQALNTVTNQTSTNSLVITRTWLATDACGNTATCQQTITVLPQVILVAPAITVQPQGQPVTAGNSAGLSVTAVGSPTLTYQWRCNGANLAGATGSTLSVNNAQFTNAGVYMVVVNNGAGSVSSAPAVVDVMPRLISQFSGSTLTMTWSAPFVLQWSTSVLGPYTDVPGATSPYSYNTLANPQRYFRLRAPAFRLTASPLIGGQVRLDCPGVPGCNYVIQTSTDLAAWYNLVTNTSPFTWVDGNPGPVQRRFYRAVLWHALTDGTVPISPEITGQPAGQTIASGSNASLNVAVAGMGPFSYQWRLNGASLAGATGSSLALNSVQLTNAGLYSVVVSNVAGAVVSSVAVVNVQPTLASQAASNGVTLTWPAPFVLQSSSVSTGPFGDVPGAVSPYFYNTAINPPRFFRLRAPVFTLSVTNAVPGHFQFVGPGVPGLNFVVQGSTNLRTWVNLATNPSPINFSDLSASGYSRRYYRAVLAH